MMATLIAHGLELQRQIAALRQRYADARRVRAMSAHFGWCAA
ncbi:hypothetical protein [Variovorax sp. EBFNA2]|nr:hypothetical protein [Variovorax boronicumulans]WPG35339.1 hypothetical protein RZE79_17790 [Variovorax boronicumulans]